MLGQVTRLLGTVLQHILCNKVINKKCYKYIYFKKVKSHTGDVRNFGNNLADKFAKIAANACKYNKNLFFNIPFQITISEIYNILNNKTWNDWFNREEKNRDFYNFNKYNSKKYMYYLFKHLDQVQSGIIISLHTGRFKLNHFYYYMYCKNNKFKNPNQPNDDIPNPLCNCCDDNIYENINHFFIQCSKYNNIRTEMFNNIRLKCKPYENKWNFNINELLYPYYNNHKLNKKDSNYFNNKITMKRTIEIWKELIIFIDKSERFKNEKKSNILE